MRRTRKVWGWVLGCGAALVAAAACADAAEAQMREPVSSIYDDTTSAPPRPLLVFATVGNGIPYVGGVGDPQGDAWLARLTIERGKHSFILHHSRVEEPYGLGSDPLFDIGGMYGTHFGTGRIKATIAVGLSRVTGFECVEAPEDPEAECEEAGTFGFPGFAELAWDPLPFLGVSLQTFVTASPDITFGGMVLSGRVGLLRR
jgi:hypothetical protein